MPISTMKKLTVLAYKGDADAIVRRLMELRCVQIQQIPANESGILPESFETGTERIQIEQRLAQIREAIPLLAKYSSRKASIRRRVHRVNRAQFTADGRAERAWETVTKALAVRTRLEEIDAEQTRNVNLMQSLLPWLEYNAPLNVDGSARTLLLLGSCPNGAAAVNLTDELDDANAYVETVSQDDSGCYFAITCHREDEDAVQRVLAAYGFVKTAFPEISTTAQTAYGQLEQRIDELEAESEAVTEKLCDLADDLDDVEILCDIEETSLNVYLQKQKLLKTRNCVVLDGWFPQTQTDVVTEALSKFECACEIADPEEGEEAPVLLHNNPFSATFEWVIGMYSYPKYGTYDPTLIMSIFYFLIFGMMFADVGYGLVLVLGCFGGVKLLNPKPGMRRMLLMFGYCGISCAIMGVLFGGWFGNLPTAIMNSFFPEFGGQAELTPIGSFFYNGLIFNPIDSSVSFLVVALAMGEIHLIAGMAINMVQTWKSGKRAEAICSTVPFWILFAGIDLLAPSAVVGMIFADPSALAQSTQDLIAFLATVGTYVTVVGFATILLLKGVGQKSFFSWLTKGLGGLYSLISFASDLLSYSRILALGLVAGVIAQVINMLTGLGATGPIGFIFMLIVMILGHVLNIAINLLGTFVHAARLQYIEFFGKFYEDGGEPFIPALPAENYSEDISNVPNENQ
ncbi:MAG: V-type ATP synthase subunit I [Clostridia bacterium]|nr:V-type ATP synthase subunit I [Clostridia bacterium]